jgi:hypothetical protein
MELVRAHDAVYLVAVALGVEVSDRRPEARDLQHHLGSVVQQELEVAGRLVVAPDVVEDVRAHVPLVVGKIGLPLPRLGVEVHRLGLLLAVGTALPRVHSPRVAGLFSCRAGLAHAAVAVHQQLARDLGEPEVDERVDVELVPEDVPAVRFAVEAAGGDACVEVRGVRRADLQDVGDVQPDQKLDPGVFRNPHVANFPQLVPRAGVMLEGLGERRVTADVLAGVDQRLVYGSVARGVEGDHLLDAYGLFLFDIKGEHLVYVVLHLVEAAIHIEISSLGVDAGAGRLGDVDARLAGSRLESDDLGAEGPGRDRVEVAAFEALVTGDALVRDPAVESGDHLHPPRPVLRSDGPLHRRLVHVGHAHEAPRLERRLAPRPVTEPLVTLEQSVTRVVLLPVGEDLDVVYPYGLFPLDPQLQE